MSANSGELRSYTLFLCKKKSTCNTSFVFCLKVPWEKYNKTDCSYYWPNCRKAGISNTIQYNIWQTALGKGQMQTNTKIDRQRSGQQYYVNVSNIHSLDNLICEIPKVSAFKITCNTNGCLNIQMS